MSAFIPRKADRRVSLSLFLSAVVLCGGVLLVLVLCCSAQGGRGRQRRAVPSWPERPEPRLQQDQDLAIP